MNLYYISRSDSASYNEFESAVVVAASEDDARNTHPSGDNSNWQDTSEDGAPWDWVSPNSVQVRHIGIAADGESGVICASFIEP